ncbi:MAG: hypothetical protein ACR2GU_01460 [Rubrobacteraceae bacterium]
MDSEESGVESVPGFGASYLRGLNASVRNNASAYGYSVTITSAFGLLNAVYNTPRASEIFAFAGGAIVAFALVEAVVSRGFRRGIDDEPTAVKMLGSSISFFSIGLALVTALLVGRLIKGFAIWPAGSFITTDVYLFVFALELSVAERLRSRRARGRSRN